MRYGWLTLLVLFAVSGCRDRKPEAPPTDSTVVDTAVVDTAPTDTLPDDEAWREEEEFPPESEVPDTAVAPRAASTGGLPIGPSAYPENLWCRGDINLTVESMNLQYWPRGMAEADACGMRIVSTIPRKYYTTNGENVGRFDLAKAKATIDRSAAALNRLPVSQRDNLLYVSILDDMGCKTCWPPDGISGAQTAALTRYARDKFPSWVAVGLRVDPQWMNKWGIGGFDKWGVNVSVMQWHSKKGPRNLTGTAKQRAWYEEGRLTAPKVGVKRIIYSANILKCDGGGNDAPDNPCTPTELEAHLGLAIDFDNGRTNCGSLSWRWDSQTWSQAYQDVWRRLAARAKSKPRLACK